MPILQSSSSVSDPLKLSEIRTALSASIYANTGNSLRDYLTQLGKSGTSTLSIQDFAGTRIVNKVITSNDSSGVDLNALFTASTEYVGWNSVDPFIFNVWVWPNVNLYNTTLGGAGITVGNLPSNVTVFLRIEGNVIGGPGDGGIGGDNGGFDPNNYAGSYPINYAQNGQQGGPGIDFTGWTGSGRMINTSVRVNGGAGGGGGAGFKPLGWQYEERIGPPTPVAPNTSLNGYDNISYYTTYWTTGVHNSGRAIWNGVFLSTGAFMLHSTPNVAFGTNRTFFARDVNNTLVEFDFKRTSLYTYTSTNPYNDPAPTERWFFNIEGPTEPIDGGKGGAGVDNPNAPANYGTIIHSGTNSGLEGGIGGSFSGNASSGYTYVSGTAGANYSGTSPVMTSNNGGSAGAQGPQFKNKPSGMITVS